MAPEHLVEEAEGPTVDVVGVDDVVAGVEQVEEGVGGGETGGEGETVLRSLQRRQAVLQRVAGEVVGAGVLVPLVLAR